MAILHVVPGDSAGGSLKRALENACRNDIVLPFPDNFSYGPIDPNNTAGRWEWWRWDFLGNREQHAAELKAFWDRVTTSDDRVTVWWGRHSSRDCAFYLALAALLPKRPFHVNDVTGTQYAYTTRDGFRTLSEPAQEVGSIRHEGLERLLNCDILIDASQRDVATKRWCQLQEEDAPFRVLSELGLISAPINYFDSLILEHVSAEWRRLDIVLWEICERNRHPYVQVGTGTILMRLANMVADGRVLADAEPFTVRESSVRLSGTH